MKITIAQVIEAAEKNGFEWTRQKFYNHTGDITQACILGQAALNLDVVPDDLLRQINRECEYVGTDIWQYNDHDADSYESALKFLKSKLTRYSSHALEVRKSSRKRRLVRKSGI